MTAAFALKLLRRLAEERHAQSNHDTLTLTGCEYGECEDAREALRILEERLASR